LLIHILISGGGSVNQAKDCKPRTAIRPASHALHSAADHKQFNGLRPN
jgi:hypothetical protein